MKNKKWLILCISLAAVLLALLAAAFLFLKSPEGRYQHSLNLGNRYLSAMKYENAVTAFTEAIQIKPRQPEAYIGRGDAYVGMSEPEKAKSDYIKAVELAPELSETVQPKIDAIPAADTEPADSPAESLPDSATDESKADDSALLKPYLGILKEYRDGLRDGFANPSAYPDVTTVLKGTQYNLEYALIDLANDSEPELFIADVGEGLDDCGYMMYDLYGIENGTAIRMYEQYEAEEGTTEKWDCAEDIISYFGSNVKERFSICDGGLIREDTDDASISQRVGFWQAAAGSAEIKFMKGYARSYSRKRFIEVGSEGWGEDMSGTEISEEEYAKDCVQYAYQSGIQWKPISELTFDSDAQAGQKAFAGVFPLTENTVSTVDLNADGSKDQISYTNIMQTDKPNIQESVRIQINGQEYTVEMPSTLYKEEVYAADLNVNDSDKNIIINNTDIVDNTYTAVCTYNGSGFSVVGKWSGRTDIFSIKGDGSFKYYQWVGWGTKDAGNLAFEYTENIQGSQIQTANVNAGCVLSGSAQSATVFQNGYTVETAANIPLYSDETCQNQTGTIPSGSQISILNTSSGNPRTYYISNGGTEGWINQISRNTVSGYSAYG
ncbi:MAG: tetratricopeptide repeat protein [Lachnospiraceae bacterium]|jgi:tetratricopeptide (TPR) repeat protein|nr:tetratricopeptide repeat protein [Lachnospiraceae bacterium]